MMTPLSATIRVQLRSRRNQRVSAGRASKTSATCIMVSTNRHNVGGFILLTLSPGSPTIDTGYGPNVVSAINIAKASAAAVINTVGRTRIKEPSA